MSEINLEDIKLDLTKLEKKLESIKNKGEMRDIPNLYQNNLFRYIWDAQREIDGMLKCWPILNKLEIDER